jgi:L-malate glycosyltransferase
MRLCYIADANSIYTHRWILPLVRQGYQVCLLSYKPVQRAPQGVEELVDLTQITNTHKLRFAWWTYWIRRYLRHARPNILHAHQVQAAGWLAAGSGYHPLIVSGWGSDLMVEPHRSVMRRMLVALVLHQCDHFTVPSQAMYEAARQLGFPTERLHLVPWGVDTDVFRATPNDRVQTRRAFGLPQEAPVVLCPRAVAPLYNLDTLLTAVKAVLRQSPDLRLVMVHFNVVAEYLDLLERKIEEEELQANVLWLPAQETEADMARLYRMADIVVSIPSSEGYGSTVYEALACGIPTIISDLPAFEEVLMDGVHALKVPVRDAQLTGQALARLLTDQVLRQTLLENGLQVSRQASVQKRVAQVEALYRQVVPRSHA